MSKVHMYKKGAKYSVAGCQNEAEYEVYLYDYYSLVNEEFYEQDYTCPFLCSGHMNENERQSKGIKQPRGNVYYPFTNAHSAQGYTKYEPIREVYSELFITENKLIAPSSIILVNEVNSELMQYLKNNPQYLRSIDSRLFEKVVAEIFRDKGFSVELTPQTRDGGKDIIAVQSNSFGKMLYVVECKRYSENNHVGVEIVRNLFGVQQANRASMGIIATTSFFTSSAIQFASPLQYNISLKNYHDLKKWLEEYSGK